MEIEILGTGGGLGTGEPTTAIRVDGSTLVDAGSGLERLSLEEIRRIRRVFITHAHMDHVCGLPLLVETLFESAEVPPLEIHALPEVIRTLREHVFNERIWPDFSDIPDANHPSIVWCPQEAGDVREAEGLSVESFETWHGVPSCGYRVTDLRGRMFVFTGDTRRGGGVLSRLNEFGPIDVLMTECSLPDRMAAIAERFYHLTPSLLTDLVEHLHHPPGEIWLGHFKPGYRDEILADLNGSRYQVFPAGTVRVL